MRKIGDIQSLSLGNDYIMDVIHYQAFHWFLGHLLGSSLLCRIKVIG